MSYVNTELISRAIQYYTNLGYLPISVPIVIDYDISKFTRPEFVNDLIHSNSKVYSGSAEQSFLQLMKDNKIKPGKYQALTPCFRDEKTLDDLHLRIFLKLELIHIGSNSFRNILTDACIFFNQNGVKAQIQYLTHPILSNNQIDLCTLDGIELGSYGFRTFNEIPYSYGTGLAEPRFSHCLKLEQESRVKTTS